MAYNFKKEVKVYVVSNPATNPVQYNIDISDINFSQNFKPHEYKTKTIQLQNMFRKLLLKEAATTYFDLTFPAIREGDFRILFNRALDYLAFDLYIETRQSVFKIANCVITNTVFNINKYQVLSMSISGDGARLTREGDTGTFVIPGTVDARSSTMTYNRAASVTATIGGVTTINPLVSATVELQTDISWVPNAILEGCGDNTLTFPSEFRTVKQILSGTLSTYYIDDQVALPDTTFRLEAGEIVGSTLYGFDFDIDNASVTSRTMPEAVFKQYYDWRMTQNPASLLEVIKYNTLPDGVAGAILDHNSLAILDSDNLPILESV